MAGFYVNTDVVPPICLPEDVETGDLVDVTMVSDTWRKFWDVGTGRVYDGKVYHEQLLAERLQHAKALEAKGRRT